MAIIYKATLSPTKQQLLQSWSDRQPGGGAEVEVLASYRFDDPQGEVGVEAFLLRRREVTLHVPLTYRAEPLAAGDADLIGTTEHSVLGTRWVYDGTQDPVAVSCFERALYGEQQQAVMEVWDGPVLVERRDSRLRLHREPGAADGTLPAHGASDRTRRRLQILREVDADVDCDVRLVAEWDEERAVVAALWTGPPQDQL